jgi:signal transduction histidine kinase
MLQRPLLTLTTASSFLVFTVFILCLVLLVASQRSQQHLQSVTEQLTVLSDFEDSARAVVRAAFHEQRARLEAALVRLQASRDTLDLQTAGQLAAAFSSQEEPATPVALQRRAVLGSIVRNARAEWWLILLLAVCLAAGTVVLAWQIRRRVVLPLDTLNRLLNTMTQRRYELADLAGITPDLRPLFESYNDLVQQVSASEEAWARREAALRGEVRDATRTLMQQQLTLLREQRMAEAGELCAQIAHDMRNPLAGILAAVGNLQRESSNEQDRERLGTIREEVKRVSRQLDGLVDSTRLRPEEVNDICVCEVTESVLALTSYQLGPDVELGCDIDPELIMRLPEDNFRHALLNLIINAANSIGRAPGSIEITSVLTPEHVVISVRDSGSGFSADALAAGVRAFGSYSTGGTGLGLAAVRRFISDLGGQIAIANRDTGGASVSLKFPSSLRQNPSHV